MSLAKPSVVIRGTGSYAPDKTLTNDDLTKIVDTSDEWIVARTGIKERRIAADHQMASDLGAIAGQRALEDAKLAPEDIDIVIVATITPDKPFPSTACLTQTKLGIPDALCMDIEAACSGFLYIMEVAAALLQTGRYKNALIIGTEKLSSILDWQDRTTCVLFGDGAGAAVLTCDKDSPNGIIDFKLGADGSKGDVLYQDDDYLRMRGKEVFKLAVKVMQKAALQILEQNGVSSDQLDCVIPHQANLRIIDLVAARLGLPMDKFFLNLQKYGNTSAASIPIALDEAYRSFRLKKGDTILLLAFGAGLTWGSTLIKWDKDSPPSP